MSTITGTPDNDFLNGTGLGESIFGFAGHDNIDGGAGNDDIFGGDGNDTMRGGDGDDALYGGDGDDLFILDSADYGVDDITGGDRTDFIFAQSSSSGSSYSVGIGSVSSTEWFVNTSSTQTVNIGADDYTNLSGITAVSAGAGIGSITGGSGDDYISGFDTVYDAASGTTVNWDDSIHGGSGNDQIYGNSGNDTLNGGTGNDTLNGNDGNDVLTGGSGADHFRFNAGEMTGWDVVTDFEDGVDLINIFNVGTHLTGLSTVQYGTSTAVVVNGASVIELENTDASTITIDDFNLV